MPRLLPGILAMAVIVTASNILVQFPLGGYLTWGALTYPFAFLVTDLVNRLQGAAAARRVVLAGWRPAWAALGLRLGVGSARGLDHGAEHLLDLDWKRPPLFGADQRQGEEGQSWDRFPGQTGKEAIHPVRVLPRFGHDSFITAEEIDIGRVKQMRAKEDPKDALPGDHGGKKALNGAITAARARPPRHPLHRDPPRHRQHCYDHPAPLPDRGQRQDGGQTGQKYDRISHGLLLFLRWFGLITPTIRQKPILCDPLGHAVSTAVIAQAFGW
ncbi:MAG: hypothetical protein HC876_22905 [Chloroflexaceae bacterium]|nr:hypothetical protein [Chloroflexaceae bacterium]